MSAQRLDYFTDVLCVWAYASQIRLEELKKSFRDRLEVHHHFVPVFGDMPNRLATKWKERGGREGFAQHLQDVGRQFPHVKLHAELCRSFVPSSSMPAHIFLKAAELACGRSPECERAIWEVRLAWFRDNRPVDRMPALLDLGKEIGLPVEKIHAKVHSGEAMAAVSRDIEMSRDLAIDGSPTWLLNDGRQKLYGNVGYRILEANVQELLDRPGDVASWC